MTFSRFRQVSVFTRAHAPHKASGVTRASVRYPPHVMRLLLVTPPMIQLNTPYPATAYLTGFLRLHAAELGLEVTQADASIALFLRLFSAPLVTRMAEELRQRARTAPKSAIMPPSIKHFLAHAERYADTVEPAIRFLQRRDPSLAFRIVGPRLSSRRAALRAGARRADSSPRSARWARPSRRVISPACTSTISPTSGVTASIRASSWRVTASDSPRARRPSIRCTKR